MAIINGNAANNVLIGTNLADTINGFAGNDVLIGLAGADTLIGGIGADAMIGGAGNDTYFVDNVGDTVAEGFNEGIDRIVTSISLSLSAPGRFDVENLTLSGGAIVGTGNGLGNQIVGNNFANTLSGLAGNDSLFGMGGNDQMFGGTGNDFLNGGLGADNMTGSTGNDTYVVDNPGDVVTEAAAAGIDQINSSISTSLNFGGRLNVENLTLTGTALIGTGNALNNTIVGTNFANTLNGLAGNDSLFGVGGNDRLFGGIGADTLQGGAGNDFHNGGAGVDQIVTGTDFDTILFNAPLGIANFDRVLDFAPAFDTMQLENAFFTGLTQGAFLPAGAFVIGTAAADAADRIIYNSVTGNLFFDQDGTGAIAQVLFADLASGLAMTNNDFFVV